MVNPKIAKLKGADAYVIIRLAPAHFHPVTQENLVIYCRVSDTKADASILQPNEHLLRMRYPRDNRVKQLVNETCVLGIDPRSPLIVAHEYTAIRTEEDHIA